MALYAGMPTENKVEPTENLVEDSLSSPSASALTDEFGTNVGEKLEEEIGIEDTADESLAEFGRQTGHLRASRCNIGATEQKVRIGAGVALLAAAAFAPVSRGWKIGLGALGAAQIVTGMTTFCPLWHALGINTQRDETI